MQKTNPSEKKCTISMGQDTFPVPVELFALNRRRLLERLHLTDIKKGAILLQGGDDVNLYNTDVTYLFRQEPFFMWTFGVLEPGCYGVIDIENGIDYLFVPRLPESYSVWMGRLHSLKDFEIKYGITHAFYVDQLNDLLTQLNPPVLLTMKGVNSDSGLTFAEPVFDGINNFQINNLVLYNEMADLRVIKTNFEIDVMKYVSKVSSAAHRKVMRMAKAGMSEYQCESEFLHYCYKVGGCRHVSYTCICASGVNGAILHYGHAGAPNDKILQPNSLCLFDMGANYFGYASDITCTFPVSGQFTSDQKLIYEAVLAANRAVTAAARPGVLWSDMHLLANKVLLGALIDGGLLKGDLDEMVKLGFGSIFQPHGLGHLIGLDVHDVGGYLPFHPPRLDNIRGLNKLRTNRVLQEHMALTIEPGCYFIDCLLDEALSNPDLAKFMIPKAIERFRGFGGVRIEDVVIIMQNGVFNLTHVPRTIQEIEDWIAGKDDEKY